MTFNSITYLLFLILVTLIYWNLSKKYKSIFLVTISLIFYGFWRWDFIPLILVSAISDFIISRNIYKTKEKKSKKILLYLSILINIGILVYFKYLMFFLENSNKLFEYIDVNINFTIYNIILPFGISFYTFETISYTVDVYRGIIKPEKKFIDYLLFVTFFPKLVAGPIQRANELIPQLKNKLNFNINLFTNGLERLLYGLFLKVVLADNISPIVDEIYSIDYNYASPVDVLTMSFMFGFQIYFDFSAYSHIAIGSAKIIGIEIPENFNFPYMANSLKDFWKRWHISLSAWIKDYLYLPLAGKKVTSSSGGNGIGNVIENKKNIALFLTWIIMGFWHGANWTFIFWGLYHAFFILMERILKKFKSHYKILNTWVLSWGSTLVIAMLSWIPFRVSSLENTFLLYKKLFDFKNVTNISFRENTYIIAFLLLIIIIVNYIFINRLREPLENSKFKNIYIVLKYFIIVFLILLYLKPINQFIYFQF